MPRDADLELSWLKEQGIEIDAATDAAYRNVIAVENAAAPDVSMSTAKRLGAQKKSPVRR